MQQFIAKIIFRIICGNGIHTPQFDEQLIFITAHSETEALHRAHTVGSQKEESYLNDDKEKVYWKFIGVAELQKIESIDNGVELYSSIREVDDAPNYISMIHFKEQSLQQMEVFANREFQ